MLKTLGGPWTNFAISREDNGGERLENLPAGAYGLYSYYISNVDNQLGIKYWENRYLKTLKLVVRML